ncbi:Os07g0176300 [Oryza sativa Japonica Group]|uniref:Os07g0176300 protein n=1 Tax=Oryza sativa subsp. japonica TaxID=39947 RepID=Q0D890_ORYSJ|nr:Os07g0176300 [Oryza sativa Japonica Group]|eukprot:NP_001059019.1 Os07g0176300 [Oryza sativa Japonica Group]
MSHQVIMLWLPLVASPSSSSRPQACQAAVRSIVLPHPHASVRAASGNPVQAVSPVVPAAARRQSRSRPHQLSWSSSSLQVAALVNGICRCRSSWRASPHQLHIWPPASACCDPLPGAGPLRQSGLVTRL